LACNNSKTPTTEKASTPILNFFFCEFLYPMIQTHSPKDYLFHDGKLLKAQRATQNYPQNTLVVWGL
jgi:hypothetical protein